LSWSGVQSLINSTCCRIVLVELASESFKILNIRYFILLVQLFEILKDITGLER